jgi:ABC-type branched-subunit amino acid transport system ATPase component
MTTTPAPVTADVGRPAVAQLVVENVSVVYSRAAKAVDGLSFTVGEGESVALLGPNGAGKTTSLRAITGFLPGDRARIEAGRILFDGKDITGQPPNRVTRAGISMVAERDKVFPTLSVAENLRIGAIANRDPAQASRLRAMVDDMFPILRERRDQMAGYLSGGERQMLSISAALLGNPRILLVDELSLGLAPRVVGELVEALRRLNRDQKLTMLLVEQSAAVAFELADYVYVLSGGRAVIEGGPADLRNLSDFKAHYLGVRALAGASFALEEGELAALIGPNGSGKTSLLNCINGFYRPQRGSIRIFGHEVASARSHEIARWGVARTFQNVEVLGKSSVIENVLLGRHVHIRQGVVGSALQIGRAAAEERRNRDRATEILDFLGLREERDRMVGSLPYGTQKLVEIGRALAMEPRLLLLDEPTSGMTPIEKDLVGSVIRRIRTERGVTQLLIEHDMGFISDLCGRVVVLNTGAVIADATPQAALSDPAVVSSYLGVEFAG